MVHQNSDAPNGFTQKYSVIIQTVTVVALFMAGAWTVIGGPMLESRR
jgi:hypothetical protein